jgi:hypothetical protein
MGGEPLDRRNQSAERRRVRRNTSRRKPRVVVFPTKQTAIPAGILLGGWGAGYARQRGVVCRFFVLVPKPPQGRLDTEPVSE